ncbi:MAG: pitrilysin family protein [Planctomycetota bacterium]
MRFGLSALLLLTIASGAVARELTVEERKLSNGMTVLIVERHTAPVVSFNIKFRVGSADEEAGRTGVAHILEHMLFKGTPVLGTKDYAKEKPLLDEIERLFLEFRAKRWALPASLRNDTDRHDAILAYVEAAAQGEATPKEGLIPAELEKDVAELVRIRKEFHAIQAKLEEFVLPEEDWKILERNGARGLNASTGADTTQYFYSLPSNRIELWAMIESGRMRHPILRQFYKEKEAIKEERRMRVDSSPQGRLFLTLMSTAFQAHSYLWPTIGWSEDIAEVSRTEVEQFFREHYAPNRAVATVVGDVDPDELVKIMERWFGDIPCQPEPRPVVTREPRQMGERRTVLRLPSNPSPSVLIGYHRPALGHPDFYVLDVITGILGQGRTSRLTQSVYFQKRLGQAQCGNQDTRFENLFVFSGTPVGATTTEQMEAAIYEELERMKTEPVTDHELARIKNLNEAMFVRSMRDNAGLANILGTYEVLYGWEYITTYREKLAAVTKDDIMRVAKKYFREDNRSVVTLAGAKEEK